MSLEREVLPNRTEARQESLRAFRIAEAPHVTLAIQYSLKRWEALTRYLVDGYVPIDNNWPESQTRPWAVGPGTLDWLFAGSLRAGRGAAAIMSLIHCAQLNGHDPYVCLKVKDMLTRLTTHRADHIAQLLPHHWRPLPTRTGYTVPSPGAYPVNPVRRTQSKPQHRPVG